MPSSPNSLVVSRREGDSQSVQAEDSSKEVSKPNRFGFLRSREPERVSGDLTVFVRFSFRAALATAVIFDVLHTSLNELVDYIIHLI